MFFINLILPMLSGHIHTLFPPLLCCLNKLQNSFKVHIDWNIQYLVSGLKTGGICSSYFLYASCSIEINLCGGQGGTRPLFCARDQDLD